MRADDRAGDRVRRSFESSRDAVAHLASSEELRARVAQAADVTARALRSGGKVLLCGNGGSAADCQHVAGELVGRFRAERRGYAAVALTTDTSVLTAVANDYGYEDVFRRQVEALGREGDVLLAYSTSGNAENVLRAVAEAKRLGLRTIGLTGAKGGRLAREVELAIRAPADETPDVQVCHEVIGHTICGLVESALSAE
jgi:D-sedoheptulose 7-phosphate isomerase